MIVAVTGASGFCGAYAGRALSDAGHTVVGVGRRPGPLGVHRPWDAAGGRPDLTGVDAVVHLAAAVSDPGPRRVAEFHRVNVDGARRLLDASGERPVVWVSSSSVYDTRRDRSRVTEDHPTAGGHLNAYAATKAVGDRLAREAGAVVLRPRAVYGLGDPHLLPRLLSTVRGGRSVVPGPDVRLSLTHVANLADACVAALGWLPGAYNVGDPAPVPRDATLVRVLSAALGRPVRVAHLPLPLAYAAADAATALSRLTGRDPRLSRYSVDTVGHDVVLDLTKARGTDWEPRDLLAGFVDSLSGDGPEPGMLEG